MIRGRLYVVVSGIALASLIGCNREYGPDIEQPGPWTQARGILVDLEYDTGDENGSVTGELIAAEDSGAYLLAREFVFVPWEHVVHFASDSPGSPIRSATRRRLSLYGWAGTARKLSWSSRFAAGLTPIARDAILRSVGQTSIRRY